jgi:hypothetical protein
MNLYLSQSVIAGLDPAIQKSRMNAADSHTAWITGSSRSNRQ